MNKQKQKRLVITMKEYDKHALIKRCQEKDKQGWDYVHPIKSKVIDRIDISFQPNGVHHRFTKKKHKIESNVIWYVTMFKESIKCLE